MNRGFYFLCGNAGLQAESFLQKEFSELDLTPAQANLLLIILDDYPCGTTVTQLHERIGIAKSSLSSLIKPLRQKGYLRTENPKGDERIKALLPTEKLKKSREKPAAAEQTLRSAMLKAVGENKLTQICELLDELCRKGTQAMKKTCK